MRRALGYLLAGAAGGAAVTLALAAAGAVRAARERELLDYFGQLTAWRIRENIRSSRFIRGEIDKYEPEMPPQFRLGKRA